MPTSRNFAKALPMAIATALLLALLISTTGCARRYVAVDAGAPANATQGDLDRCFQDNELLLKALEECRAGK